MSVINIEDELAATLSNEATMSHKNPVVTSKLIEVTQEIDIDAGHTVERCWCTRYQNT